MLQAPFNSQGHHRVNALEGEALTIAAPYVALTQATCVRAPEGVDPAWCACTVSGNTLQIAPLPRPGVYGFLIVPITGIPLRLYVIAFRGDAVDLPRLKFDAHAHERPLNDRMLVLRGVACEARLELDGIDEALADPMWHTRGEIVGAQGSLNLANYGA